MRQTNQYPFAGGRSFAPNLEAPKAQVAFNPGKHRFGAGLPPSVERAQKRTAEALFHESALLPFPLRTASALGVVRLGIQPALRGTQDQKLLLALDLSDLLGVIVTSIHQHSAGSTHFGHNSAQSGSKLIRIVRRITQMRSDNESAWPGVDHRLDVVTLHRATSATAQAPALRFAHARAVAAASAPLFVASAVFPRRLP